MDKHLDYTFILIICFLLPIDALALQTSWREALPVAAFFGGLVGGLAIAKKIIQRRSVTIAINNRMLFPFYQRFQDEPEGELHEDELRERSREQVEKAITSLIVRTQKRLAVIGAALTIAAATKNQWWNSFANNTGWIQARTEFSLSMIYYFYGQEGMAHPLFSSPIRESLWVSSALIYTQFYDLQRNNNRMHQYDFPELVFITLSYLYEIGRMDR